ncbi:stage VI sporulation protein F [Patescibacteria group bacterium]|nr:stage VI sporulation protein F [Patescibacteria group bacterium]
MKKLVISSLVALLLMAYGCGPAGSPGKSPEEMIKNGVTNFYDVERGQYDATIGFDAKGEGELSPEDVMLAFDIVAKFDSSDKENPLLGMEFDGEIEVEGNPKEELAFQLKLMGNSLFAYVSKLPSMDGALPAETMAMVGGKWWEIPVPDEMWGMMYQSSDEGNMTDEQKAIKELARETNFFEDIEYQGTDNLKDGPAYKYEARIDEEELQDFFVKVSKLQGQPVEQAQMDKMQEFFDNADMPVVLWVDADDEILKKVKATLSSKNQELAGTIEITLEIELSGAGEDVEIERPADSTLFDVATMMGGMPMTEGDVMGGAMNGGEEVSLEDLEAMQTELEAFSEMSGDLESMEDLEAAMAELEAMGIE